MKLIDENGKLFGLINVIDLLVILCIITLIPAAYFGYQKLHKKVETKKEVVVPKTYNEIEINCNFIKLDDEIMKRMLVGDREVNEKGEVIGEILKLGRISDYESSKYVYNLGSKHAIDEKVPTLKQRRIKLSLKVEIRQSELYYNNNLVKIKRAMRFKTEKYTATVIPDGEIINLKVRFQRTSPEVAQLIKTGDTQVTFTSEGGKKVEARILKIISIEPTNVTLKNVLESKIVLVEHPQLKDVIVEIEAVCAYNRGQLYFNGKLIKIGQPFEFSANEYKLDFRYSGKIIEISNGTF